MKVTIALSAAATALALTGAAYAQSPGQPWNADQLSSSLVGKQIEHIRSSDGRKFVWDVRKGAGLKPVASPRGIEPLIES